MEEYVNAKSKKKWVNPIIRSWNEVGERGKTRLDEEDLAFLVKELAKLDNEFTTHFEDASYFMTTTGEWTSLLNQYEDALRRYADSVAQRAHLSEERTRVVERMKGKLLFFFTDTNETTTMPPLPLLTRGMLTSMTQSIREVKDALNEVSKVLFYLMWSAVQSIARRSNALDLRGYLFAGRAHSTCEVICSQVEHIRPARLSVRRSSTFDLRGYLFAGRVHSTCEVICSQVEYIRPANLTSLCPAGRTCSTCELDVFGHSQVECTRPANR